MATYTHRTITTRREEWVIPMETPRGTPLGGLHGALDAAATAYNREHDRAPDAAMPDDALWISSDGTGLVVGFEVELDAASDGGTR